MSDIVERLRARKMFWLNGGIWLMSSAPDRDCQDAADEIECLRALAGSMGHQVECPPVPKSIDPTGW